MLYMNFLILITWDLGYNKGKRNEERSFGRLKLAGSPGCVLYSTDP